MPNKNFRVKGLYQLFRYYSGSVGTGFEDRHWTETLLESLRSLQIPILVCQVPRPATQLCQPLISLDRVLVYRNGLLSDDEGLLSFTRFREEF